MDLYQKLSKLGEGSFGKVYLAREKATGKLVAVKVLKYADDGQGVRADQLREISILQMLSDIPCPQVVRLLNNVESTDEHGQEVRCLVFEYLDMDMRKLINEHSRQRSKIQPDTVKSLMYQLCKGIDFIHGRLVLHRDLKPDNVLMDRKTLTLKIADLGMGRSYDVPPKPYTNEVVTRWYRAPEVILAVDDYHSPIDMWSAGCIFAELVTTKVLFHGHSITHQLECIFRLLGTPTEDGWPGVEKLLVKMPPFPKFTPVDFSMLFPNLGPDGLDLLKKMLLYNPTTRISAKDAMRHTYFDDLDKTRY